MAGHFVLSALFNFLVRSFVSVPMFASDTWLFCFMFSIFPSVPIFLQVYVGGSLLIQINILIPVPEQKKLFTPGPLGVSLETKQAMLRDFGSRDTEFMQCIQFIRSRLLEIAEVPAEDFAAIPLQGSGTYAVEAVLTTTTPRDHGKVFIMQGGAYGRRLKQICDVAGLDTVCLDTCYIWGEVESKRILGMGVDFP